MAFHELVSGAAYADNMPGWEVIGIDSEEIIPWSGAIHCIAMTIPAGNLTPEAPAEPAQLCPDKGTSAYWCDDTMGCGDITSDGYCDGSTVVYCGQYGVSYQQCAIPCYMNLSNTCDKHCAVGSDGCGRG